MLQWYEQHLFRNCSEARPIVQSERVPEHVDPDSEYSMRRWRLRRSSRAIEFAQQMLREAHEDTMQGSARARIPIWIDQAMRITERVVKRLAKGPSSETYPSVVPVGELDSRKREPQGAPRRSG